MTSLDFKSRKQTFLSELSTLRYNAAKAAERERHAAQNQANNSAQTGNTPSQKSNAWFKNYGTVITRYLQQVHSIETINGLAQKLNAANVNHDTIDKGMNLSFRTLDSIVKSCEKWREYLADKESFDLLVCLEVISMTKIHASVIAARDFDARQGASGVHLKSDACVPHLFTTVVSYHGMVQVFS